MTKYRAFIKETKKLLPVTIINFEKQEVEMAEENGLRTTRKFKKVIIMESIGGESSSFFEGDIVKYTYEDSITGEPLKTFGVLTKEDGLPMLDLPQHGIKRLILKEDFENMVDVGIVWDYQSWWDKNLPLSLQNLFLHWIRDEKIDIE